MKYWCYYTDVVRYLERLEASQSPKTAAPAYLVWQDDDGPSMIIGPGVEWYRGDGPPPDIDAISMSLINRARRNRAATVRERSARARPNRMKTSGIAAERACAPAPPNRTTQSRKTWRAHSCVPCRHSWRHVLGPQARHQNPAPPSHFAPARQKRRTKGVRIFQNPLKTAHPTAKA